MALNVQVGRWIDVLRKRMGVQSHMGLNVVDDIFLTYPTHPAPPEDLLLRDEFLLALDVTPGPVAAQFSYVRFGNPAGSGRMICLERINVVAALAIQVGWGLPANTPPSSNLSGTAMLDARALNARHNVAGVASGTALASTLVSTMFPIGCAANNTLQIPLGFVITPGNCVEVWGQVVNTAMTIGLVWREWTPSDEEMRG